MLYINNFEKSHIDFIQTGFKDSFFRGHYDFIKIIFRDKRKTKIFRFERIMRSEGEIKLHHPSQSYKDAYEQVKEYLK